MSRRDGDEVMRREPIEPDDEDIVAAMENRLPEHSNADVLRHAQCRRLFRDAAERIRASGDKPELLRAIEEALK